MVKKKGMLSWYFESNLLLRILIGLILGAIAGIVFQNATTAIDFFTPFGDLFIRLLKMIVMPVIIFTLIVGTSSIEPSRLGKVGVKIIIFYLVTSFFAICIGLLAGNLFQPGSSMQLLDSVGTTTKEFSTPTIVSILLSIVPTNPFAAIAKGDVLPTIFFSVTFGLALAFVKDSADEKIKAYAHTLSNFFEAASEVIFKIVGWIMQFAPIGVFALIFAVFSKQGAQAFGPLANVTITVYIALIFQVFIVYSLVLLFFKLNPLTFLKKVRSPFLTAFVTRSSGGTLPVSMEVAQKEMGVSKGVCGFTLPIGATINMDGTTIYLGVCAIFIANIIGQPLDFSQQVVVILTAVLASIGTAGVPGAGALMLLMVLNSVGIHVEAGTAAAAAYALIFGIDALLDMGRTGSNVAGDLAGTVIVAKAEGELDMETWKS